MNLWLRLFWVLIASRFGAGVPVPGGKSVLGFRVWFHDLDTSLHMNNGRYLTIMDLGRLDMMARSGLLRAVFRHGWTPIASSIKIRYRREMRLFERFHVETRLAAWEAEFVVMEQVFILATGPRAGQVAAHALFKGGLYDRKARAFIPVSRLLGEVGASAESPPMTPEIEAFLHADDALKRANAERMG
jgi:acyl-CoA thioesterase FadM